jgi:hypothetical protein
LSLNMEAACISEMSATLPTFARHDQRRTKVTYY